VPFPELGKADTRSGKGTGSTACEAAPERLFRAAEKAARRTQRHNVPSQCNSTTPSCWPPAARTPPDAGRLFILPAACAVRFVGREPVAAIASSHVRPTKRSGASLQAFDPGPTPGRVSAFPSSGVGPGSIARTDARVCLSKLWGRSRIERLQPARVCLSKLGERSRIECLLGSACLPLRSRQDISGRTLRRCRWSGCGSQVSNNSMMRS